MTWLWIVVFALITYIPLAVFFAFIPYLTRRTESFGVSIPEAEYNAPELKKLRRSYRNVTLLINFTILAAVLIIAVFLPTEASQTSALSIGIVLQIVVMFLAYLRGHFRMKKLKAEKNWQSDTRVVVVATEFSRKKITVSPWWFGLYVLVIIATAGIGLYFYPGMPERVPIHFDLTGRPDGWVDKSPGVIFFLPIIQTLMFGLMLFVYWVIRKAKQQIDAGRAEQSVEQNRIFRYRWSAFTVFMGLVLVI